MITPNEIKEKILLNPSELKKLERIIDREILNSFKSGKTQAGVDTNIFSNQLAMQEMIQRYNNAGWKVDLCSDEGEGQYMSIKPRKDIWNYTDDR